MHSLRELALFTLVVALGIFVLGSVVFGWTNPSANPPSNNVAAPLNAGGTSQTKSGNLSVNQLTATVSNGTAPLVVTSQTKVANLNADLLDGLDSSGFGDATLSNQSSILGKIGTSTDAANMDTTLFGGQQFIHNLIGAASDGANMGTTLFAGQQYIWDNRASFGPSVTEHRPSNWTCTIRDCHSNGSDCTASCSGSEKMINFGWYPTNNGCSLKNPSGQGIVGGCGSGDGGGRIWVNCCQ